MSVNVSIPTALRQYVGNQDKVALEGATVGEVLERLGAQYPNLKQHLFNDDGSLRNFVNVYANDEDIRYLQKQETPLKDGDSLMIVPSVAGGASVGIPGIAKAAESVELSKEEIERYSRHLIMPEVGMEGQKRLKAASILCIGTGGLGSPLVLYLAAAGVGRIGLVDFDIVDYTNLQRQVIHGTKDVGKSKLESAKESILDINPYCQVDTYETLIDSSNALEIMKPYDVIVDGTDNFPTRYLVNDACVLLGKPNVYGSIFRFEGQCSVFWAEHGPCYRCLYPEPPPPGLVPSCAEGGVLGILPGIIGVMQATEAVKLMMGKGNPMIGRLLLYNALDMSYREMKLRKDPSCPVCGENPTVTELIDYQQFCGMPNQEVAQEAETEGVEELSASDLYEEMRSGKDLFLLDVREAHEYDICALEKSVLIPLGELGSRYVVEVDREQDIVVYCRSGARSAKAVQFLQEQGYSKVRNLEGGILAWSDQVDPSVPKY